MKVTILDAALTDHPASQVVDRMQRELRELTGWPILADVGAAQAAQATQALAGNPALRILKGIARKLGLRSVVQRALVGKSSAGEPIEGNTIAILITYTRGDFVRGNFSRSTGHRVAILYDAWEPAIEKIAAYLQDFPIDKLYVTARQSAEVLAERFPHWNVEWLPESVATDFHPAPPLAARTLDVVQFGRKNTPYHNELAPLLERAGRSYLYEKREGEIICRTHEAFLDTINNAKISICFPRTATHPETAGSTETMTLRYLQSFMAGCVVVGKAPAELVDLFGYNPVLELSPSEVLPVLDDPEAYQDWVERNRQEAQKHTWAERSKVLIHELGTISSANR